MCDNKPSERVVHAEYHRQVVSELTARAESAEERVRVLEGLCDKSLELMEMFTETEEDITPWHSFFKGKINSDEWHIHKQALKGGR